MAKQARTFRVDKIATVVTADLLNGTDLAYAPGNGVVGVWAASDTAGNKITCSFGGQTPVNAQEIMKTDANYQIQTEQQAPMAHAFVKAGDKLRIDLPTIAGGNVRVTVIYAGS